MNEELDRPPESRDPLTEAALSEPRDPLTEAALSDPGDVRRDGPPEDGPPTLWRLLLVVAVAVAALAMVFWR